MGDYECLEGVVRVRMYGRTISAELLRARLTLIRLLRTCSPLAPEMALIAAALFLGSGVRVRACMS